MVVMAGGKNTTGPLTCDPAAKRLSIAAADLPDLGCPLTVREVAEPQREAAAAVVAAQTYCGDAA